MQIFCFFFFFFFFFKWLECVVLGATNPEHIAASLLKFSAVQRKRTLIKMLSAFVLIIPRSLVIKSFSKDLELAKDKIFKQNYIIFAGKIEYANYLFPNPKNFIYLSWLRRVSALNLWLKQREKVMFFLVFFSFDVHVLLNEEKRNYLVTGNKATIGYTQSRHFSFQSKTYFLWNVKLRWNYITYEILLWFQSKVSSNKYVYIDLRTSYESESQDNCPREKLPPHPKTNPKPNPNPNGGGDFSRGQLSGCPPNPQTKPHLDPNPDPNRGQLSPGGNCPDTVKDLLWK